jgi:ubiquinone/menaquinone biosynthesis C-methylase UbiE
MRRTRDTARVEPFERHANRYDAWFVRHRRAYEAEIRAVRALLPGHGLGLEIGVGTGRFAEPLGVQFGIDPAEAMLEFARSRGVRVAAAAAEALPFRAGSFDFALMVTTICFVANVTAALKEAHRVLKRGGLLVVGFVDSDSPLGREYQGHGRENVFYRDARFFSADEVAVRLRGTGFCAFRAVQTIFHPLDEVPETEPVKDEYGEGSFVVLRGEIANESPGSGGSKGHPAHRRP